MTFNMTLDDKVSKFTVNIPLEVRDLIDRRRIELNYRYLSDYLLDLIEFELQHEVIQPRRKYRRFFAISKNIA